MHRNATKLHDQCPSIYLHTKQKHGRSVCGGRGKVVFMFCWFFVVFISIILIFFSESLFVWVCIGWKLCEQFEKSCSFNKWCGTALQNPKFVFVFLKYILTLLFGTSIYAPRKFSIVLWISFHVHVHPVVSTQTIPLACIEHLVYCLLSISHIHSGGKYLP